MPITMAASVVTIIKIRRSNRHLIHGSTAAANGHKTKNHIGSAMFTYSDDKNQCVCLSLNGSPSGAKSERLVQPISVCGGGGNGYQRRVPHPFVQLVTNSELLLW